VVSVYRQCITHNVGHIFGYFVMDNILEYQGALMGHKYYYYYLAGCTMFPHLPAPI